MPKIFENMKVDMENWNLSSTGDVDYEQFSEGVDDNFNIDLNSNFLRFLFLSSAFPSVLFCKLLFRHWGWNDYLETLLLSEFPRRKFQKEKVSENNSSENFTTGPCLHATTEHITKHFQIFM